MRLTDSHIALTSPPFSHLFCFSRSLSRFVFDSRRFSSGKSFWVLLAAKDPRLHLFADSSYFSPLQPPSRSYASSLSRGPRIPAGLFVTPVFPGIPDLELIFVGRKLCRSHPWINFAPSTNHRRTIMPRTLFFSFSLIHSLCYYCIMSVRRT